MNKKLRRLLHKILTSALVYIAALALPLPPAGKIALFVIAYFIVGFDILKNPSATSATDRYLTKTS